MQASKYNILSRVSGQDQVLLVNLLSGQADLLSGDEAAALERGDVGDARELCEKGYWVDPEEEQRRYRRAYLDFIETRDEDEIQLFYVGSYTCNFACSYCYQDEYAPAPGDDGDSVLSAFFAYVDDTFRDRKKYVTLFGGEPLLPNATSRRLVERMVEETAKRGLDLAVVTNGYHLESFVPLLAQGRIREIQVTLDGSERVHDSRRYLKGGGETFARVVAGVDACLAAGLPVNLRTVIDRENIAGYAELAHFAIDRGWTPHPLFKTQIGRNYELHHCQVEARRLYTRLSLYEDLMQLIAKDRAVLEFHRPAFSISRFLFENGELPEPLFDACPACKTEWAFDYTGRIYPCTANVGKEGEAVGSFYPKRHLDPDRTWPWEDRDVVSMEKCRDCSVQLACGGGCGAVSKNQGGSVSAPDCRPVRELLSLGAAVYGPPPSD